MSSIPIIVSALGDHYSEPWMAQSLAITQAPRLPTPGKRIKYAAKKRSQRK